jgi:hypothetical protein
MPVGPVMGKLQKEKTDLGTAFIIFDDIFLILRAN